nr:putative peptidyl-tRNA hydrolase PTRHD1 [Aedes albopictus]
MTSTSAAAKLVQYVVVNGEIAKSWPKGAVIAQCCHAVSAVSHLYSSDPDTVEYFKDLDNMHKVVLEAPDVGKLNSLGEVLQQNDIKHKVWIEQPENIPTCIALKPYRKEDVHKYVKKFKLLS